jgi:hypothetical protein
MSDFHYTDTNTELGDGYQLPVMKYPVSDDINITDSTSYIHIDDAGENKFNIPSSIITAPSDMYVSFHGDALSDNGTIALCEVDETGKIVQVYSDTAVDASSNTTQIESPRRSVSDLNLQQPDTSALSIAFKSDDGTECKIRGMSIIIEIGL